VILAAAILIALIAIVAGALLGTRLPH